MSIRTNKFEDHALHTAIRSIDRVLAEIDSVPPKEAEALEQVERVRQVHVYLKTKLNSVDPNMVALQTLDNLNEYLQSQLNELTAFRQTDATTARLNTASVQSDHILIQLSNLPVTNEPSDVEGIRQAVTSLRKSVGQYIHNVEQESENSSRKVQELSARLDQMLADIVSQKSRLDTAITNYQQQFSEAEDRRREEFTQAEKSRTANNSKHLEKLAKDFSALKEEHEKVFQNKSSDLAQFQQRLEATMDQIRDQYSAERTNRASEFSEDQKERNENFEALFHRSEEAAGKLYQEQSDNFKNFLTQAGERHSDQEKRLDDESRSVLKKLEDFKTQAQDLVHIIANTGMAGGYQRVADEERKAARYWHTIAGVSMAGLVGFAIYAFVLTLHSDFSWGLFAGRAFVAITFGIFSTYAAREAEKHREVERRNRRVELELASINPYLSELDKNLQQDIKQKLAERLFAQSDSSLRDTNHRPSTGTSLDLVQLALENLKTVLEHMKK